MKKRFTPKTVTLVLLSLSSLLFFPSCQDKESETPTRGHLTMISSEDVYPVIDLQVKDFTRIYEDATIMHLSSSTRDAIVQLLNDSVKLIVCPREFNDEEQRVIRENALEITTTKIALDAVAVIVNAKNALTKISVDDLRAVVRGERQRWTALRDSKLSSAIVIGIGEPNSGVFEYVKTRLTGGGTFSPTLMPCSSTAEVLTFVKEHPNAIGFVPVSWLTDLSDSLRVLEIGDPAFKSDSTITTLEYFAPHQAYIYQNFYPFSRPVYIYSKNAGRGVAIGFTSFSAGVDGQKIIVKNGLVPMTMPVRLVQLQQQ